MPLHRKQDFLVKSMGAMWATHLGRSFEDSGNYYARTTVC